MTRCATSPAVQGGEDVNKRQNPDFETTIAGIPCGIKVLFYEHHKPWRGPIGSCPSDLDYYGYTEFEYMVLDRKGYVAEWLRNKLTDGDEQRILREYQDKA